MKTGHGTDEPCTQRVMFILEWLPAYRLAFLESLRRRLDKYNIELSVVHGTPSADFRSRLDAVALDGALSRRNRSLSVGRKAIVWQPWRSEARQADLVVVNEGARLALNYWLLAQQALRRRPAVAYWGHGSNLDSENSSGLVERAKKHIYRLPHWWFPYTEGSKRRLVALGFPLNRTTVVQNTVSTELLQSEIEALEPGMVAEVRRQLGLEAGPTGLFLGSLYGGKRIPFLLSATDLVHKARPDFSLVIAGEGPDRGSIQAALESRPYARFVGRADGSEKAALLKIASFLLTPGAVGLNAVDGFVAGLPTVATAFPNHGPEFEYLEPGINAEVVPPSATPRDYAQVVLDVLNEPARLNALQQGAQQAAERYSGAEMVRRFSAGIREALSAAA